MSFLRKFWQGIRSIKPRQWFLGFVTLVVLFILFLGASYAWDYTNSAAFCGTQCHTMPPHYDSYQRSPHARVQCTECHIGRTFIGVAFTRKAVDAQFVWAYLTGNYEYPIHAKGLQPARESCEKCHWPEKFSWDKVITLADYQTNEKNTQVATTLVMKTGGGSARTGLGRGIHWHIENIIEFKYTDKLQQEIPWISVTNADGTKTIYTDIEKTMTASQLAGLPTRLMDCIDCHNRVSHTFMSPDQAVDAALQNKLVDEAIPEIKKKGIEVLTPHYKTDAEAKQAIGNLDQFYKQNYSAYYTRNNATIQKTIKYLQDLYPKIYYRDQELDWTTHPDNVGHKDWPGCFRCHDGKHFTPDRKESIRLECNVCHAIPEVTTANGGAALLSLSRTDEPPSHKTTTWLAEHRTQFNTSCQVCHDTNNAGGKDNTSFCSNSACHGIEWKFAGLNAPKLAEIVKAPIRPVSAPGSTPRTVPHPVGGNPDCQICHAPNALAFPYPVDHTNRPNSTCLGCHKPAVAVAVTTPVPGAASGGPPKIPHSTAGRTQCLGCHGTGTASIPQITQFHKDFGFTNNNCLTCHKAAGPGDATATPSASQSAQPAAGGIKKQPADHAGRVICLACHQAGVGPKPPADHAGRADDTCKACHLPS
ncbi:MAG: NapC/NirT family cytochrome c [Chloroflexi bacterium]|nr:NapC/NirT family cytochrome c [Chloroflexota bacterium]